MIQSVLSVGLAFIGLANSTFAFEIAWTRMAGQWPVEASPVVFQGSGETRILILNRGGQLLLWKSDGTPIGTGQDGLVRQLPPEERWTTAPTLLAPNAPCRFVVTSVEGHVIGLDQNFQTIWQYKLRGETVWGSATPALFTTAADTRLVFTDSKGTLTCLTSMGAVAWTNALDSRPSKAAAQIFSPTSSEHLIFAPAGSVLFCYNERGKVLWNCELGTTNSGSQEILTRPEVVWNGKRHLIVCGTAAGKLCAVGLDGKVAWELPVQDTFSGSVTLLPRKSSTPLILFTGLWGNLHAVDIDGYPLWTHFFRAKVRASPLVLPQNGNEGCDIFVPTFHQHIYQFSEDGELVDDIRLSGILPSSLTPTFIPSESIPNGNLRQPDLFVTSTTLLAYRLKTGSAKSQYGETDEPRNVRIEQSTRRAGPDSGVHVHNPNGALLKINISTTGKDRDKRIIGQITARSEFEIPLPEQIWKSGSEIRASVRDATGKFLEERRWLGNSRIAGSAPNSGDLIPSNAKKRRGNSLGNIIQAWPTAPYAPFNEKQLSPLNKALGKSDAVAVRTLYVGEVDQGAFIIASHSDEKMEAAIRLITPVRKDRLPFAGGIVLRKSVLIGAVNGEDVPDALQELGKKGVISLTPHTATKIWVSIDAHGAAPGNYAGRLRIGCSGVSDDRSIELPLLIEVLDLHLPTDLPMKLCTWDYVPNRWFPEPVAKQTLHDMSRHGVNIFPRSTIPPAKIDSAQKLIIDWATLDAELVRLDHRGKILFHLNHPPITFPAETDAAQKGTRELEYIHSFRDHLHERGWGYSDYAFYLLDEPGLDYGTNVPVLLDAGKLFREADPKLLTYTDPVPGLSWKDFERIEPLVDIWAPNMRLVSGLLSGDPRINRIMNSKTVWSYECVAQVKSLSPLRYNRANAWRAKFFGLRGIGFWTHSTTEVDPWQRGKTFNDEYALVYPGETPVPSVRWEAVRDGLEDAAAIALLEEQIKLHRQHGSHNKLVTEAEKELRIALRDVMELSDEAFVESRDFLREGDRILAHTNTDAELFRHHRAEIARLTKALSTANDRLARAAR